MSGPKAVRVISRAERIARCEDLLAELDAQVSEWLKVGNRLGVLSDRDRAATSEKVSLLRQMLMEDKFDQVDRQAPVVVEFLRCDLEERITDQAAKKRRAKTAKRRLRAAAEQVLPMLESSGHTIDPALNKILESASQGLVEDLVEVERAINNAVTVHSASAPSTELNEEQRRLAESLRGSARVETVTDWIVENAKFDDDLATRIEGYIADLEVAEGADVATPFTIRVNEICEVENRGRRRMLFDTLIIDLAAEVKAREQKRRLHTEAVSLKAIIERDSELSEHRVSQKIGRLLEQWDGVDSPLAEQVLVEIAETVEQQHRQRAAQLNRAALLEAFSELGYEIREGLETAWVNDKRIVVRKSEQLDHGVEVSGNVEGGRIQVRPVRFEGAGTGMDRRDDVDIETIWCSEFGTLREIVERKGGEIAIEKAKAIGETPVKTVPAPPVSRRRDRTAKPVSKRRPIG